MNRRMLITGMAALVASVLVVATPARAEDFSDQARQFMTDLADEVVNRLTGPGLSREQRSDRFRKILHENFAVDAIGQWVLGRYWRAASAEQRNEYLRLFEDLIVATYVNRFEEYNGQQLEVRRSLMQGDKDAIVQTRIIQPQGGGEPVDVSWRVRKKSDGSLRIVDVIVEGVSMGQTQRSEFASVIRKHGGSIDAFLSELRQRVQEAA